MLLNKCYDLLIKEAGTGGALGEKRRNARRVLVGRETLRGNWPLLMI